MVLSKRERVIVIAAAVALAAFVLDRAIIGPFMATREQATADKEKLIVEVNKSQSILKLKRDLTGQWQEMQKGLKSDPTEAEAQVMHAIQNWAQQSGFGLSLLKPDRPSDKTRMPEILFQAVGSGTNKSFYEFLNKLQSAPVPVKVSEIQIATPREGADDLSVTLRISTLYLPKRPATASEPAAIARGN